MKKLPIVLIALVLFTAVGYAEGPIVFNIRYTSLNNIDASLYSLEEPFLRTFGDLTFAAADKAAAGGKTIRIEFGCVDIHQVSDGKVKYNIFLATVKGKITIIAATGEILLARDIEEITEPGPTAMKAEHMALKYVKDKIAALIEREKAEIHARLK